MKIFNLYKVSHNTPTILVIDITNVDAIDFSIEGLNAEHLKRHLKEIEDPSFGGNAGTPIKLNKHSDIDKIGITSDHIIFNKDLNFLLENFIDIESVSFNNCKIGNIDILQQLKKFNNFGFTSSIISTPFDLTKLRNLNSVFMDYNKNLDSIFNCIRLEELEMHKFSEKESTKFIGLTNLKKLILRQFKMTELEAVSKLSNLEYLEISHNRIIDNLDFINQNKTIKELHIMNCPKIKDFSSLSGMKNLERLSFDNQKEIPSLDFVKDMPKLKGLGVVGSSNVIDGKLKWMLDRENFQLACEVKKHYDIKWGKGKEYNILFPK